MGALETFFHLDVPGMPLLVRAALAHVQFETIHPFLDGNVPALCRGRNPRADPYTSVCISRRTGSVTMSCSDAPLLPFSECIGTCSATRSCRFPQPQGCYRSPRRQSPKPCGICKSSALFGRPLEGSATGCSFIADTFPVLNRGTEPIAGLKTKSGSNKSGRR
jgi:hypothetical protein